MHILVSFSHQKISYFIRNSKESRLVTEAMGSVRDIGTRPAPEIVMRATMSTESPPIVGIHQNQGLFKVIPTIGSSSTDAFNVR